mgnify:CR=1 FL=1
MLAMYQTNKYNGFTLIELLIALVLLGLISSVVSPAVFKWMESREAAAKRSELENAIASLPIEALLTNNEKIITDASQLPQLSNMQTYIDSPIIISNTGFCVEGTLMANINSKQYKYEVEAPFCKVKRVQ